MLCTRIWTGSRVSMCGSDALRKTALDSTLNYKLSFKKGIVTRLPIKTYCSVKWVIISTLTLNFNKRMTTVTKQEIGLVLATQDNLSRSHQIVSWGRPWISLNLASKTRLSLDRSVAHSTISSTYTKTRRIGLGSLSRTLLAILNKASNSFLWLTWLSHRWKDASICIWPGWLRRRIRRRIVSYAWRPEAPW